VMTDLFAALLCGIAAYNSYVGAHATRRGHEYYRRASRQMNVLAKLLGYHDEVPKAKQGTILAVATTEGQEAAATGMPSPSRKKITTAVARLLSLMMLVGAFGCAIALYLAYARWTARGIR